MDIIDRLKKGKKDKSVFDALTKKKEEPSEAPAKQSDIEVTPLGQDKAPAAEPVKEVEKKKTAADFHAEGLREFDIESLSSSVNEAIKGEYKPQINKLIDEGKIDEAMNLLQDLKTKLMEKQ